MEENQIHIPEGWFADDLGNLIKEKRKSSLKVSDAANYGEFPFFTSGETILQHTNKQLDGENIFLATGGIANIKYFKGDAAYSTDTYVITTKDEIETKYLYFDLLNIIYYINANYFQGSGLKHLQKKDLKKHQIFFPKNTKEQTQIATILSKVDKAIAQTEQLIAKYTRIKTGLMQDLLSKGIDENGNIRSEETHEFKDSPLGRIPKEWECEKLDSFLLKKQYGISLPLFEDGSYPILRMNNIKNGELELSELKYTSATFSRELILNDKDVLFNRTNSIEYVGRTGIFRKQSFPFSFASYLVRLTPNDKVNPEFLNIMMNFSRTQNRIKSIATSAVHQANINPTNLGKLFFSFPKLEEQDIIISNLKKNNLIIENERQQLTKLQSLKTGLMQDLLSGKVRVNHLIKETTSV